MIIVPEIVIKQELDVLMKVVYDDLINRQSQFTVADASDGDIGGVFSVAVTQQATATLPEVTDITLPDGLAIGGKHWLINTPSKNYFVWYNTGLSTAPELPDFKGIEVKVETADSAIDVAVKTAAELALVRDGGGETLGMTFIGKLQVFVVPVPTSSTITVTNKELNGERQSFLFDIFGDLYFDNMGYFKATGDILKSRYESESRKLVVNLGYNQNHIAFPQVSILLPSEESDPKLLNPDGLGSTNFYNGQVANLKGDNYQVTYNLLITSDNYNEVVLVYHFLKSLIKMGYNNFTCRGLNNLWVSGRDITLDFDINPASVFHRTIAMTFFYENTLPDISRKDFSTAISFNGTNIG